MTHVVLGVSADYHDAAAAVVVDGRVVAAAEEERFSRRKHDPSLPVHAIEWCLAHAGVGRDDLDAAVFYSKPFTTYERVLATQATAGPRGLPSLTRAIPTWSRHKLWAGGRIEAALDRLGYRAPATTYAEHHVSHAASAFYPSPFESAAVLTVDGVGEWTTTSIAHGRGAQLEQRCELGFPDSIGLLYSAFTAYAGFEVNDGEYKLMGLAPYGRPRFADVLREHLVESAPDGSYRLRQRWFDYRTGQRMTARRMSRLLEGPPRRRGDPLTEREADLAASVQVVVEEMLLALATQAHELTGESRLCLAGGVALNCVANSRLAADGPFGEIWVQPAAGDAGGAVGAALWYHHHVRGHERVVDGVTDAMQGAFLGPAFTDDEVAAWLEEAGIAFERCDDLESAAAIAAAAIDAGGAVGWFQGRMEFGPRALGHRSILADPRDADVVRRLNLAVKGRESFRPFAPAVLEEHASEWFDVHGPSPYMLFTAPVASRVRVSDPSAPGALGEPPFEARLAARRSQIPACTHVDGSARVQTVGAGNPEMRTVVEAFHRRTGVPVLVNTSFNRRDEPIVRTPADAYRCFVEAGLDMVVLERCIVRSSATRTEP